MAMAARVIGPAARPRNAKPANAKPANAKPANAKPRRYEFVGWEFKPDKRGVRQKRAILRDLRSD
jgi:hypothetical protein